VKKLTVTSHQLCEKFKYIPGQFGVDFLWISVDFGENGVDFGENGQVLTPTDETFEWGVGGPSVDLEWIWGPLLSISVDLGSILVTFWWMGLLWIPVSPSPATGAASSILALSPATFTATSLDGACNCIFKV
jgi:hypothetical protein